MASYAVVASSIFLFLSALFEGTLQIRVTTLERVLVPLGGRGRVPCDIDPQSFNALYWSRKLGGGEDQRKTVVSRRDGRLTGDGLDSGDFNISEDNSLVINFMHLDLEATYICLVLDENWNDVKSTTDVIATVKPEAPPTISWGCGDKCRTDSAGDNYLNLTCTSDEAKPAVTLTWMTEKGTPIEDTGRKVREGTILKGTSVTTSTILYDVRRDTTLTCQAESEVIGRRHEDQRTEVKLYETVTPSDPPDITASCPDYCQSGLDVGTVLNLTCTSAESRPLSILTWFDPHGTPIEPLYSSVSLGSLTGAFQTVSTIQFNFTTNTSLVCRAEVSGDEVSGALATRIEITEEGIGTTVQRESLNAVTGVDPDTEEGPDIVTILLVAVSVAVGVVVILGIVVAVLYKKNKEYIDAISYSYCLSRDGYNNVFPRSAKSYHRAEPDDYLRGYSEGAVKL